MSKSDNEKKKRVKSCPHYDRCSLRLHPLSATDNLNMAAHLGFRFFYTLLVSSNFVINLPSGIDIEWIWKLLALIVFVTAVDWLCNDSKFERADKFQ